jgi:hypothetical protein
MNGPRRLPNDLEHSSDAAWLARVQRALDESEQALDAATLSRLNRARQRALETAARGRSMRRYWPAAFAAFAALALAVALWRVPSGPITPPAAELQDFELLASQDHIELYEDLEFYAWLDAQPADG